MDTVLGCLNIHVGWSAKRHDTHYCVNEDALIWSNHGESLDFMQFYGFQLYAILSHKSAYLLKNAVKSLT
ncbi:hypothetical protein [Vibrio penaeicida]|uniref:hypothetical protein n=1 Tax=Vibrio penaeicida TaxID=104609 RepID=UPI000F8302A4|nr:hypothetical protein [Vibrio penaeicida]RTZ20247.1 hypothetical protein EKN09_24895 [Vibrio penaeicida]